MKNKKEIINKIKKLKSDLQSRFDVEQIGIFGSFVHEKQTPKSDLDILIELKKESKMSLLGLSIFEDWLSDILGIKVDLVLKSNLKPKIGKKILDEVVYL
jgi:uncharacterized protein